MSTAASAGTMSRKALRSPSLVIGIVAVVALLAAAVAAPWLAPHDPSEQHLARALEGPAVGHALGFDDLGRDVASRLLLGARLSLSIATAVVAVSVIFGTAWGLLAGTFGGWVDELTMRVTDVLLAFPGILLAMAVVAVTGRSATNIIVALSLTGWVGHARLVRGQVLRTRELDYVQAARAMGAGHLRLMGRHLLPACLGPLLVQASLGMGGIVVAEAGLAFLGLGVGSATPSWGEMLLSGTLHYTLAPHLTIFPGACIALAVLAFNFLGDGLRDVLDPRQMLARNDA